MTAIAFAMNCLLAMLLLAAMMVGLRLEKRLRGLRDSHAGFAQAAFDLNGAIARAEAGLAEMRKALRDADETLTERVDEARAAARKLEMAMRRAEPQMAFADRAVATQPPEAAPDAELDALPIKDLLARLRGSIASADRSEAEVLPLRDRAEPPAASRSRARVDDDLFEIDAPRRAGAAR